MEKDLIQNLIAGGVSIALGLFAWMARTIFLRIERDLMTMAKDFSKLEGKLDSLQTEIRANTISVTESRSELRALWRITDAAHERASDSNGRL